MNNRILQLIRLDLLEGHKARRYTLLFPFAFSMVPFLIGWINHYTKYQYFVKDEELFATLYITGFMAYATSRVFQMKPRTLCCDLLRPASTAEKFWARYLLRFIGMMGFAILSYAVADALSLGIIQAGHLYEGDLRTVTYSLWCDFVHVDSNDALDKLLILTPFSLLLLFHSFLLAGSAWWHQHALRKTLTVAAALLLMAFLTTPIYLTIGHHRAILDIHLPEALERNKLLLFSLLNGLLLLWSVVNFCLAYHFFKTTSLIERKYIHLI